MRKLEELETEIIRMAIARYHGRMSEVARRLGIGRSTLYRKLKDLGLEEAVETPDPGVDSENATRVANG
jgi:DNA-binding NtrC family response regulator